MRKMIDGWVHIPGIHCGSAAIRNIMKFYGYDLSEAMCFGLGSGMGFFYTVSPQLSPTRMIFLRGPGMEYNFFNVIGIPAQWKQEDDADKALKEALEWVERGVPVLVQTDIYYLPYYNSKTHFPGHVVAIWGYDDDAKVVYVSDTDFEELQSVPYELFKKARSSKASPFPLRNNWFEVNLTEPLPPLAKVAPRAIEKNARMMIEGVKGLRGESSLEQIRRWSCDLTDWPNAPDWKWCARFGYQVIARRGVEGAGFRWMYRDFLKEVEELVPGLKELGLSGKMDTAGAKWAEAASLLKAISERDEPAEGLLRKASEVAYEIWEIEGEYYGMVLGELEEFYCL
jgi:hypothetical protein